ncbi:MAG: sensor histidine kinase [Chloroflexota bacterium]
MKIRNLLTNVWLISLIPAVIISFFLPIDLNEYSLSLLRTDIVPAEHSVIYDDLDSDGVSERIVAFNLFNSSGLSISSRDGIIDQWNFHGSLDLISLKGSFIIGDKDNDRKKEIYVFTFSADSILLHCIGSLQDKSLLFSDRLVARAGKGIKKPDPFIIPADMEDLDGDGSKELIFGIGTGFSKYPRKVFSYFMSKDSLAGSPDASYFIQYIKQVDVNDDGVREILPWGYAAGNITPEEAGNPYHDYNSYLFALRADLKFLFSPIAFPGEFSEVIPFVRNTENGKSIAALYSPPSDNINSRIFCFDTNGAITDSLNLDLHSNFIENAGDHYLLPTAEITDLNDDIPVTKRNIVLFNRDFKVVKTIPFNVGRYHITDIDSDGLQEYIFQNLDDGRLYIFRDNLTSPVSEKITIASSGWDNLTLRKGYETDPSISVQSGQNHYILKYSKNQGYIFSYLYFPGIYCSVLAFGLSIRSIQRNQLKKRYENEKKISELQMALIRNQLDPHFTLNAINSIIYSVNYGDRNDAANSLRCFAGMFRDMVLSAGSSRRSIEDEIAFCTNYLSLEKVRYGDKLEYSIDIDADIDQKTLIPKLLIQIHTENAIKHGISPLESGGILKIKISEPDGELQIEITDNGIGREKAASQSQSSTKKGLEVMNELYGLYSKFYNEKIISEIIDLQDEAGNAAGTSVRIRIIKQPSTG